MGEQKNNPIPFFENSVYTTDMAAEILHRHPKSIRALCKRGDLAARRDRGGYLITGWAIRAYVEGRLIVKS